MHVRASHRLVAGLAALLSGFVALLAVPTQAAPVLASVAIDNPRIMVVGDSISQGFEGDYTWRYRLKQHLLDSGVSADFVGPWAGTNALRDHYIEGSPPRFDGNYRPGVTFGDSQHMARWGWQVHQAMWDVAGAVEAHDPDVLLVELGFNDLGWGVADGAGTMQAMRTLINNARVAKPDIQILVANVPQRTAIDGRPELPSLISDYNQRLADAVPGLDQPGSRVGLVNLAAPLDPSLHSYDGLHPNVRGEYIIAKQFADRLSSLLGVGSAYGPVPATVPSDLHPGGVPDLSVTRDGHDLKLSWSRVFGATGFRIYQRDVTAGQAFRALPFPVGAQSWVSGLLPAGHRMEYKVQVVRGNWDGSTSAAAAATVEPLPVVPNVRVTANEEKPYTLTVDWDPVPGATDYAVYAYSSSTECQTYYVPDDAFKLVQWGLGSKTTWTQEYVFDLCVHYRVVATRNGGEGQWPAEHSLIYGTPYQNNLFHWWARRHFWDTPAADGDRRAMKTTTPSQDRGIVVARGFIRNKNTFTETIGDQRGFSINPGASSKVAVAWDTATGEIGVYVHRSCAVGYTFLNGSQTWACKQAFPIRWDDNASANHPDSDESRYNYVGATRTAKGGIRVSVSAINSWESLNPKDFGRINANVVINPSGRTFTASVNGDKFPAWEVMRYPRALPAFQASGGAGMWIGTRDQTVLSDLKSGARSSCVSVAGETLSMQGGSRPMQCS